MALLFRVPLIVPERNLLFRRDAFFEVDPNTYHIIGQIKITDYRGEKDQQQVRIATPQEVVALQLIT